MQIPPSMRATCVLAVASLGVLAGPASGADQPLPPPLKVFMAVGPNKEAMARFRDALQKDYRMEITFLEQGKDLAGIEALPRCDVFVSNLRRTHPTDPQLKIVKRYFAEGGAVVGLRRAHHGFQNWLEADREVFGVKYGGHGGGGKNARLVVPEDQKDHPLLEGFNPFMPGGGLYDHSELDSRATVLLRSEADGKSWPQMWTLRRSNGQRVFYTRYDPSDVMKDEGVRNMVIRAIFWAAEREAEEYRRR